MSKVVAILGVPHDPTLPSMLQRSPAAPHVRTMAEHVSALRQRLADARPDVILIVAGDHLNQWFMDNMPAFSIGKAARARGPFLHERPAFGLEPYDVPIDIELAKALLAGGFARSIDFSFSDEFTLDHGFVVPLSLLRPQQDLPIVPLFTNVMAPPVATGHRFFEVGRLLREMIESMPGHKRVAVVGSGHMANSIGGPGMLDFLKEPESAWDRRMWGHVTSGNVAQMLAEATWDQMAPAGNGTPGFLDYVLLFGVAGGARPSYAEFVTGPQPSVAFLAWDLHLADGGTA